MTVLTAEEKQRYLRQISVSELGENGQQKLKNTSFLVIGSGGLGSPALQALAASGAGRIIIVDNDKVETSNLSRQFLHTDERVGMYKAESAAAAIAAINPFVKVEPEIVTATEETVERLAAGVEIVLDCCDNSRTRHAVNKACRRAGRTLVTAGCVRGFGQLSVFDFASSPSPCYACAFPEDNEKDVKASDRGVLTILTAVMGSLEAAEAVKVACGLGSLLVNKLLLVDLLAGDFRVMELAARGDCPVCGRAVKA